jgi:hypothetical protein
MKRATDPYAVHEAGHALVAALSGLPIKWVDMHADKSSADERGWPTAVKGLRLRRVKVTAAMDVSLRMAGKAAEFVCGHDIPDSDSFDKNCASQILDVVCKSRKERAILVSSTWDSTEDLIWRNLPALKALALALDQRGRLSGAEVVEIVESFRRNKRTVGKGQPAA